MVNITVANMIDERQLHPIRNQLSWSLSISIPHHNYKKIQLNTQRFSTLCPEKTIPWSFSNNFAKFVILSGNKTDVHVYFFKVNSEFLLTICVCTISDTDKSVQTYSNLHLRDHAMRPVSWNLVSYHTTVQKLLVRQVLTISMVCSWRFSWRQVAFVVSEVS